MITIDFSKRGAMGLCECIFSTIKYQIMDGTLSAHEKLPSKRSLAEHLGVSVITVQNAYNQLIDEGYLYSLEKKGFFVSDILIEKTATAPKKPKRIGSSVAPKVPTQSGKTVTFQQPTQRGNPVVTSQPVQRGKTTARNAQCGECVPIFTDFTSNSTSVEKFPFSLWAHLMRHVLNSGDEKLLERIDTKGVLELRTAISKYLKDFKNIDVHPEQIVIGAGTENLYSMIVQLLGRDKIYAVENPGYHKVAKTFLSNDANCVPIKIDSQGVYPLDLENAHADVVHVSPSHHFPTGIVMPVRRRLELLSWSSKNGRYIIEDDYDSEFRFNGKPIQSLLSHENSERVIYVNTFSKTLSPSFRISYMVLPWELVETFNSKLGFYSCPVSAFEQFTLARFIDEGFYEKHIIRMKNYYRSLRNQLIQSLENSSLAKISRIEEENAGLHFLLSVESKKSEQEIQSELLSDGIKIASLNDFFYDTEKKNFPKRKNNIKRTSGKGKSSSTWYCTFVVNYSAIKKERINETIKRLEKVFGHKKST